MTLRAPLVFTAALLLAAGCPLEDLPPESPPPAPSSCDTRTVPVVPPCSDGFEPDSPTRPWRHETTRWLVVTQGAPNHRGADVVANPGEEPELSAKLAYGALDKDLEDEDVEVWLGVRCGSWTKLGAARTDADGRISFRSPATRALAAGAYPVKVLVKGDHSAATFWLQVWTPGTSVVVSDIDGTITTQEFDGLWTALVPDAVRSHPSAKDAFQAYAQKGYRIVYLTARPEHLTERTRRWFADNGFPQGVFHLSEPALGVSGDAAADYKGAYLVGLARDGGVRLDWAYGNTATDLTAYERGGVPASHIYLNRYDGERRGANRFDDYGAEAVRVRCLPPVN